MKLAERLGIPLVWLVGTGEGVYSATSPVYVGGSLALGTGGFRRADAPARTSGDRRLADPVTQTTCWAS
jgi:hypothetical protein